MKVFSSRTNGQWLTQLPPPAPAAAAAVAPAAPALEDPAVSEAKRALSDVLRCTNFVVLSGLGTSLCVQPAVQGGAKAPTMRDLWQQVEVAQNCRLSITMAARVASRRNVTRRIVVVSLSLFFSFMVCRARSARPPPASTFLQFTLQSAFRCIGAGCPEPFLSHARRAMP
jgi:hypothetical protein